MSLVLQSSGGGSVTIAEPATASNFTATMPAATGTVMVSGNMPAFSVYLSAAQSIPHNTNTQIQFNTEEFDTASAFNNTGSTVGTAPAYTFNPQVAGYYQINLTADIAATTATGTNAFLLSIYKNGSAYKRLATVPTNTSITVEYSGSIVVYLNGSTDYISGYIFQTSGSAANTSGNSLLTYMTGSLVRTA